MSASKAGVMVVGAQGRMGREVRTALADEPSLVLAGALERPGHPDLGRALEGEILLHDDPKAALEGCRVAIDFSVPESTLANLRAAADAGVAYVTGTTGFDEAGRRELETLAARIPVLHAPNFSVAVNVLVHLAREAARLLGSGYDAELFELHHGQKRDAPSGTALRLAEAVAQGQGKKLEDHVVLERAGETGARPEGAIGVQTLRGGDNPGEHTIYFIGRGERIELTHRAATRGHFAVGAVRAAAWIVGRPAGLYRIEEVLGLD
ncbi:MAG: 4-hydroxy-tetrahydrodipicolinate reductase [Deltaproteobacteria bacterium]|jgi:4-hydroxy-tetrahydrodipicolinate reductase|nr:4-hydroxy-tetrahydrodipicolinate reductase [Deltaproteobacteria bacterium]MBW2496329.1 4-hydroxy-tetrahydrodipicolinate reductase [Deltaproteobacteria bacterium]